MKESMSKAAVVIGCVLFFTAVVLLAAQAIREFQAFLDGRIQAPKSDEANGTESHHWSRFGSVNEPVPANLMPWLERPTRVILRADGEVLVEGLWNPNGIHVLIEAEDGRTRLEIGREPATNNGKVLAVGTIHARAAGACDFGASVDQAEYRALVAGCYFSNIVNGITIPGLFGGR